MIRKEILLALCLIFAFFGGCVSEDHSNVTASILSCKKLPSENYFDKNYEIGYQVKNNGDKTLHRVEIHITSKSEWGPSVSDSVDILAPNETVNYHALKGVASCFIPPLLR